MRLVKVVRDGYDKRTVEGSGWKLLPVPDEERGAALRKKLGEEVMEYLEDRNIEELVDILQTVAALASRVHGVSFPALLALAEMKRLNNGGMYRVLGLYFDASEGVR